MEITLNRKYPKKGYTIGKLSFGSVYFCDTLEDEDRGLCVHMSADEIKRIKVKGKTAIPKGRYEVKVTWSPRFGKMMPLLMDVPGFDGIRIHSGNDASDTEGCILCGKNRTKGKVLDSRLWTNRVYAVINEAIKRGERVWISIV